MAQTATDLLKAALRGIGAYQSGDPLGQDEGNDGLNSLNNLLDSWSADHLHVYSTQEYVLQWVAGQAKYNIGNPLCTDIGEPPFTGTVTASSGVITGVTSIPTDLKVGATLSDTYGGTVIPAGALVTAIGASTVTFAPVALASSIGLDNVTYSIPGDFAIPRPIRISGGYTRFNSLDFTLKVTASQDEYNEILFKAQPGPWPVLAWYNPQMPYGQLNVYQTPGNSGEFHLFADTILTDLALTQTLILPQGYFRALRWCLSRELWPEYWGSKPFPPHMAKLADEALATIKQVNDRPAKEVAYDPMLIGGVRYDKGFIFRGGY